jgi:hypothetical protein
MAAPLASLAAPHAQASTVVSTYDVASVPAHLLTLDGGATTVSLQNDELPALFSMGFSTTFFGASTSVFWISSNGFITLLNPHSPGGAAGGQTIPSTSDPTGLLAGFWTDLDPSQGGSVRFETMAAPPGSNASQVLVVDYSNVPIHDQGGSNSFQIQVFNDGTYEVHWASVSSPSVTATVGIENEAGTVGVQVEHGAVSHANEAIRFTPTVQTLPDPPVGYTLVSLPFSPVELDASANVLPSADIASFQVPLGFSTTFFNQSVSTAFVSEKGFVSLLGDSNPGCCQGQAIPDPSSPNGVVAGYWTDLFTLNGGTLRTETLPAPQGSGASLVFVADYDGVRTFGTQVPESFQVLVFDNGILEVQLAHVQGDGGQHVATVGIEDGQGVRALAAAHGTDVAFDDAAFAFVPDGVAPPTVPPPTPADFQPREGVPGALLSVTSASDASFPSGAQVVLGGFTLATTRVTARELQAIVPSLAPGPAALSVAAANGTTLLAFNDSFTVDALPTPTGTPPVVDDVTPASGLAGTHVIVSGSAFQQGAFLTLGGVAVTTTFDGAGTLEGDVPASLAPGAASVVVTNPDGGRAALHGAFTVEPPTPAVSVVTPDVGLIGQTFHVLGSGFASGARVFLGGAEASVASVTPTDIAARVPSAHGGLVSVHVVNPDGRSALVDEAFLVQRGTRTDSVSPSLVEPGDVVLLQGLGYSPDTALLVDGVPQRVVGAFQTELFFEVDRSMAKGAHDITVVSGGVSESLPRSFVVRWPANVVVGPVTIHKNVLTTDAGDVPETDALLGRTISVQVTNDGDDPTGFFEVRTLVQGSPGSPNLGLSAGSAQLLGDASFFGLGPGQTVTLNSTWDTLGFVGDFDARAVATAHFPELRTDDDTAVAKTFVGVGGFQGFGPCDVATRIDGSCDVVVPNPPPPPPPPVAPPHLTERKIIHEANTTATDDHQGAVAAFSFQMPHTSRTRFDFVDPTVIFDSSATAPDGTLTSCTVWRFETPRGSIQALLDPDAVAGSLQVPSDTFRSSQGTTTTSTREQFYLLPDTKPVQTRDEDEGTSTTPSTPASAYDFPNATTIHVSGSGVQGDFSQCIDFAPNGTSTERLTFAALPADLSQPQPSFTGLGKIDDLVVSYHADTTTTQSTYDEVPSERDLTQGVTG